MDINQHHQNMELGSEETPKPQRKETLEHMLVHAASPSVASGVESSVHLSNKLPTQSKIKINNEDLSIARSSQKTNFDDSADVYENSQANLPKLKTIASKFKIESGESIEQQ